MFVVINLSHLLGKEMVYAETPLNCEGDLTTLISYMISGYFLAGGRLC